MAVNHINVNIGSVHCIIETATEDTTTEYAADIYIRISRYLTGITATDNIHSGIITYEVLIIFSRNEIRLVFYALISLHMYCNIGVFLDICILTISATEDCEVRRTYLIICFLPFVGLKEVGIIVADNSCIIFQNTACHRNVCVPFYLASKVSTTIDIVVNLKLSCFRVILWRVHFLTID